MFKRESFKSQVESLSTTEIESVRDRLTVEIFDLKTKIHNANLDIKNKKEVDLEWLKKATFALRMRGAKHQIVLFEISKRNKEQKKKQHADHQSKQSCLSDSAKVAIAKVNAERAQSISMNFVDIAKKRLPKTLFDSIIEEAKLIAMSNYSG